MMPVDNPADARRGLETIWRFAGQVGGSAPLLHWNDGIILICPLGDYVWHPLTAEIIFAERRCHQTMPFVLPQRVPAEWLETLQFVGGRNSYIAGGALRDLVIGSTPKDVDIFVGPDWQSAYLDYLGDASEVRQGAPFDKHPASWSAGDSTIERIINLTRESGTLYQIIERKDNLTASEMLGRFDFGLCRIAYSLTEEWIIHNDFLLDLHHRSFTVRANHYPEASRKRGQAFKKRFPGWSVDLESIGGGLPELGGLLC